MRSVETDWWVIDLPDEWEAEQEDETIVISDEDGIGALEITTLLQSDLEQPTDVATIAKELVPVGATEKRCSLAGLPGANYSYLDEGDAVRDWLVGNDELILLISYSCAAEHRGLDDALVDEVLETLQLKSAPEF